MLDERAILSNVVHLQLESGLKRLAVPSDFCQLINDDCKSTPGCGSAFIVDDANNNATFCYSNELSKPSNPCSDSASIGDDRAASYSASVHYSNGFQCDMADERDCSEHRSCGECLSDFPMPDGSKIGAGKTTCKWCSGCGKVR